MDDLAISVVIPAFRSGSLIKESINSVLSQTFQNFEIVIVDNNASLETRNVIKEMSILYPEKIRVIHEQKQGNGSARNLGIRESRGEYIALLDDDDLMYPQRLEKQLNAIKQHPNAALVYCNLDCVSYDGQTIMEKNKVERPGSWSRYLFGDSQRFKDDPLVEPRPSVIFFRKIRAIEAGLFDERFNPFWVEETEFYLRIWGLGPFIVIPEPLVAYRLPSLEFLEKKRTGNTNLLMAKRNLNLFFTILLENYYCEGDNDIKKRFKKIQSQWLRELSLDVFRYHDGVRIGRGLLVRALQANVMDLKNWKWYVRSFLPAQVLLKSLDCEKFASENLEEIAPSGTLDRLFQLPGDQ